MHWDYVADASVSVQKVISNGAWHRVLWEIQGDTITVELNGTEVSLNGGIDMHPLRRNATVLVYLGARPYFPGE